MARAVQARFRGFAGGSDMANQVLWFLVVTALISAGIYMFTTAGALRAIFFGGFLSFFIVTAVTRGPA